MRIAAVLVTICISIALFGLDTEALLRLAFSWMVGGPTYRWILPCAVFAVVVFYVCRQKTSGLVGRRRIGSARGQRKLKVKRQPKSKQQVRQRRSTVMYVRR
jgi:hypothetical protein